MAKNFQELCKELNLTPVFENELQLIALDNWCNDNISRDVRYEGSDVERYNQYYALASKYLDDFLAYSPENITQKIPQLGNIDMIQFAAENGYERFIANQPTISNSLLDAENAYGMTLLHKSAMEGYSFTVGALLAHGANARKTNAQKQYPIMSALFVPILHDEGLIKSKEVVFRDLFASAPDVISAHDKDGNTVLHLMAAHEFDTIMAEVLKTNPKLAFLKNNASLYPVHTAILNHQKGVLRLLLDIKGVAELDDSEKRVALHFAARYGTTDMVEQCCQASNDINICDTSGKTPLHWAAKDGNQEALEVLIKNGADTSAVDSEGLTILHFAINAQNESMVRWIVANTSQALLNQIDSEGHSPLFHAQQNNNANIERFLLNSGAVDAQSLRY